VHPLAWLAGVAVVIAVIAPAHCSTWQQIITCSSPGAWRLREP
jgi:hypothetical protein